MENNKLYYFNYIKNTKLINSIFFAMITLLSIYFGKERSVFFDGADWLYEIIKNNYNYTPHYRFAVGINGIIPWICSCFTKDINIILDAFIINYTLTPILIFLILRYYFKSERMVTLFLLGQCLFHSRVFFHPNHDALTGYYYLLIFSAFIIIKNPKIENKYYLKVFILSTLVVLTHLTQYIFLYIVIIYSYLYENKNIDIKRVLKVSTIVLLIKFIFLSSGYEVRMYLKTTSFFESIHQIFNSTLTKTFYKSLITFNFPFLIVYLLISIRLLFEKKYIKFLFITLPLLFILYFMSFYFGTWPHTFAQEGYFKSTIIIPIIIFIYYYLTEKNIKVTLTVLCVIYISAIIILFNHGKNYKKYYQNINYIAKQLNNNTIFVSKNILRLEENYILHRHSTLINMIENNKCNYYQVAQDTIGWQNNAFITDTINGGFCFKEEPIYIIPSNDILNKINEQKNLILY